MYSVAAVMLSLAGRLGKYGSDRAMGGASMYSRMAVAVLLLYTKLVLDAIVREAM